MVQGDDGDDGPDEQAPLIVPPGTLELDDEVAVAMRYLREAGLCALRLEATVAGALRDQSLKVAEATNEGALEAERLDEQRQGSHQTYLRLLADVRGRILFVGTPLIPQTYSIIGWDEDGRPVALSHDGGQIIMAMGALGAGKSHLTTAIIEASLRPIAGITGPWVRRTPVIVFHTNMVNAQLPDLLEALRKNPNPQDLRLLAEQLGVTDPGPIQRMNLVLPHWLIDEYAEALRPYVALGLRVLPLKLRLSQLSKTSLEAMLGGGDADYVKQILKAAQKLGPELTIQALRATIEGVSTLNAATRAAALERLDLLERIASPQGGPELWDLVEPGVLTIFHLSGRRIGKQDVLPLCVSLLAALSEPSVKHGPMQRVFVLDEINRFGRGSPLWPVLLQVARQIRHQGSMLLMMGQDFEEFPEEMLALATVFAMFRVRSQKIFDHTRDCVEGFGGRDLRVVSLLQDGDAVVVVAQSTDPSWPDKGGRVMRSRPLCCDGGGRTRAEC